MSNVQVLLVDDHDQTRASFRQIVNCFNGFQVVAEASDGHTAIHLIRQLKPDIALLDINTPGINGLNTTTQIKQFTPDTRVIILSSHTGKDYTLEAFHVGAMGYVNQPALSNELEKALRSVSNGERWFSSVIARQFLQRGPDPLVSLSCPSRLHTFIS